MAFVGGFEHDVFVCFADADNEVLPGAKQGWIDQLAECLTRLLGQQGIPTPAVRAFIEGNLQGSARLDRMNAAATVVIVLSPAFLESDWCIDPSLMSGLRAVRDARADSVFVVEKAETDRQRTTFFDPFRHDELWEAIPGASRPLGIPDLQSSGDSQAYYSVALGLAAAIARRLKQLARGDARGDSAKVFLAEVSEDVKSQRAIVQRTLEQAGIEVVPKGRLPLDEEGLERELHTQLAACRVFVQLLGDGTRQDIARIKAQLEAALAYDGIRILQWRDERLDVAKVAAADHRQLLLRDTVRAETISDFCHAVIVSASRSEAPAAADRPTVFVDTHPQQVADVERIFRRYQRIQWDWHQPTMKSLKTVLKAVDGVIIYWGNGDSNRTQERYYIFQNQFKALRKPLDRLLIYDGPPPDKPEFRGAGWFRVANGRNGDEPEALRRFLNEIARAG